MNVPSLVIPDNPEPQTPVVPVIVSIDPVEPISRAEAGINQFAYRMVFPVIVKVPEPAV
jgi:hypothetical protein